MSDGANFLMMLQNPDSPKKPLLYALMVACFSVPYALGYRGKHHQSVTPLSFVAGFKIFAVVFAIAFVVFFVLRMLGVPLDRNDK
jgi:hypothetical protein